MGRLENVSVDELRRALDKAEESKPTQRLLAAIAYKHGVSQTELAEWHGVQRRTIYSWFRRLEAEPLPEAVTDDPRPGRPRKLADPQLAALRETLHEPPTAAGYEEANWSPGLLQRHLREAFDAEYSVPSCRRLLNELGLEYRRPQPETGTDAGETGASPNERGGGRWVPR
jgi:transposase